MSKFAEVWDSKMKEVRTDDLGSKINALNAVEVLINNNDVNTVGDVKEVISAYKEVLTVMLSSASNE